MPDLYLQPPTPLYWQGAGAQPVAPALLYSQGVCANELALVLRELIMVWHNLGVCWQFQGFGLFKPSSGLFWFIVFLDAFQDDCQSVTHSLHHCEGAKITGSKQDHKFNHRVGQKWFTCFLSPDPTVDLLVKKFPRVRQLL